MPVRIGDTGKVSVGTLKRFDFVQPTPREVTEASLIDIPTVKPETPQISWIITEADLPTITPEPISKIYTAGVTVCGVNQSGVTANVSYEILKNGVSVSTGSQSSIANNSNFNQTHGRWFNVQIGDVLEILLWANQVGVKYDYTALVVYPTRVHFTKDNALVTDILSNHITNFTYPSQTGIANRFTLSYYVSRSAYHAMGGITSGGLTLEVAQIPNKGVGAELPYGLFRMGFGDINLGTHVVASTGTNNRMIHLNYIVEYVQFRELYL